MSVLDDKRRQRRIPIDLWIEVETAGELYFQRATNLSVGGAFFDHTFPLARGTQVQLRFTLPGEAKPVLCLGEVVATKELGMGVQFGPLAPEHRDRIEAIIDHAFQEITQP